MRHIFWICCGVTLLTAGLRAQAPRNAALAGGPVYGTAISYLADGQPFVSIPAGDVIVTFGLE